jgi:predicted amidohydrolase
VVGVNRVGLDGNGLQYCGGSGVFNAMGEVINLSKDFQEIIINNYLSKTELNDIRINLPFIKDC